MAQPQLNLARRVRRETQRVDLTNAVVDRLVLPKEGRDRYYIFDQKQPRLAVCVTAGGSKCWYRIGRVAGRPERVKLGEFPDLSVTAARAKCAGVSNKIAEGIDPAAARREARGEATFQEMFESFLSAPSRKLKRGRSAVTTFNYRNQYALYLSSWADRGASKIVQSTVKTLHRDMTKAGKRYQANRVVALVSAVYEHARAENLTAAPNPARGVDRNAEDRNERYLRPDEAASFLTALAKERNRTLADAVTVALYTGARRANACGMRWDDVDLVAGTWHIPSVKGGKPLTVALPAPVREVLANRKAAADDQAVYVFPSDAACGHVTELRFAIHRACQRAGIPPLRAHDLRHTAASWLVAAGASLPMVARQLGHRHVATTARYAHLELDGVRQALERAAATFTPTAGLETRSDDAQPQRAATGRKRKIVE